jgi:protein-L-isoaspartate(D-aspartate) O-methyltransferase
MIQYDTLRKNMVNGQITTSNVRDERIVDAFLNVERELYTPPALRGGCYRDADLALGHCGRFLLAPVTHARMIEAAMPGPSDVVLDIGCATGYGPAIWSGLVSTVIALESEQSCLDHAAKIWGKTDVCNVAAFQGDMTAGCAAHGPYDIIFLNGSAAHVPDELFAQLAPGGRLVCVIREAGRGTGCATRFSCNEDGHISALKIFDAAAPYLPGFGPPDEFSFTRNAQEQPLGLR